MSLPQGASDLNRAVLVCQRIKRMSGIVSVLWFRGDLLSGEADGDTLQGSQHADDLADAESGRCTDRTGRQRRHEPLPNFKRVARLPVGQSATLRASIPDILGPTVGTR